MTIKKTCSVMLAFVLAACLAALPLAGCASGSGTSGKSSTYQTNSALGADDVTLVIAGSWSDSKALETVANQFMELYPNCTIEYDYLQDFNDNLPARLNADPASVDLFFSNNVQADSPFLPYAADLLSLEGLDTSSTFKGLVDNFAFKNTDASAPKQQYSIPTGAEIRGLYVNTTLLKNAGVDIPRNRTELLEACAKLKDAGYVPMQGNPGLFSVCLLYSSMANDIANASDYEATYQQVNSCEPGVSELFSSQMELMYTLMENDYYNYKYIENTFDRFKANDTDTTARSFLGIKESGDTYVKEDDMGQVLFLANVMSLSSAIDKWKADCNSSLEYTFIPSPVEDDGGSIYLSPSLGMSIVKSSEHLDWATEFMNFFFSESVNKQYAELQNIIPNTADAMDIASQQFDLPSNHVSELGQVTFDYDFYSVVTDVSTAISKGNNPKYMKDDGSGNLSLYPFDYYMDKLEASFQAAKPAK